jgi:hypothetical protein
LLLLATLALTACGGTPTAPSTPAPQSAGPLDSGSYLLTVTMATSGTSGFTTCASLTIDTSAVLVGVAVPTPVHVERTGTIVTIAPDDASATFRMQLQVAGANLSGTASGQYSSSATTVAVAGRSGAAPATLIGLLGGASASGMLDGTVSVDSGTCSNNGHSWTLRPR